MTLVRWNPFAEFINMQERMNRLLGDTYLKPTLGEREVSDEWSPAVDIYEDTDGVMIKVELPEMDMKDIDVKIEDNTLRVLSRSFTLPTTVDQEKVKASYDRGVLKITLPKKEDTKPKKIKIEVT